MLPDDDPLELEPLDIDDPDDLEGGLLIVLFELEPLDGVVVVSPLLVEGVLVVLLDVFVVGRVVVLLPVLLGRTELPVEVGSLRDELEPRKSVVVDVPTLDVAVLRLEPSLVPVTIRPLLSRTTVLEFPLEPLAIPLPPLSGTRELKRSLPSERTEALFGR